MSAERETKIIITPLSKVEIELKSWLTGQELQNLEREVYKKWKVSGTTADAKFDLSMDFMIERTNKAIEMVVVKIGDQREDILKRVLNMRSEDYNAIVKEVNEIASVIAEEKKSE